MRVHWTNTAVEHLLAIYESIAQDSQVYARQVVDRLIGRSEQIGGFPLSGRTVPEYDSQDIREMIEGSYRINHRLKPGQIDILAVVHGAQLLPLQS